MDNEGSARRTTLIGGNGHRGRVRVIEVRGAEARGAPVRSVEVRGAPVRGAEAEHEQAPALGSVARDAIDHVTVIVRDTAEIARLKVEHVADRVKRDLASRVAWGAVAATFGVVGSILLLIAIFIGLGAIIESVAWRLAIYAIVFLGIAIVGAMLATRHKREDEVREPIRPAAPPERTLPRERGERSEPAVSDQRSR